MRLGGGGAGNSLGLRSGVKAYAQEPKQDSAKGLVLPSPKLLRIMRDM